MRIFLGVISILLALMGLGWFLQGIDILPGSLMTGQARWAVYGILAMFAGGGLFVFANRRPSPPAD
ncbi:MAG TPA: hypothetical protein VJK02_14910 [Anaerolineales bacterium]|nr:hypothetical protein [Anaerolineales bacterium]